MQNWLFPETPIASAIEAQMDDPLDRVGQLYYAAMESATTDARSKLKETKRAMKSLRAEMSDAEKTGNYKLAAEKARECASLCDSALKTIDDLPKSMPKAIILDIAITVILILGAALAWKALNKMKVAAEDKARATAASEKAAEEVQQQLSKNLDEAQDHHDAVMHMAFRMEKEGHDQNVRAVNEMRQTDEELTKLRKHREQIDATQKRIQKLIQERRQKSVEEDPEMAKLFADYRAAQYKTDEAYRKNNGMLRAYEKGYATRAETKQSRLAIDAFEARERAIGEKLKDELEFSRKLYEDPSMTETGSRAQSIVDRRAERFKTLHSQHNDAAWKNSRAHNKMKQAKELMAAERANYEKITNQHIADAAATKERLAKEYMSNPTDAIKARTAELSKGSRTKATAGKALSALASLIPGGAAVSSVAKALSDAVKDGKMDSTDINPFIAAYKNDLKKAKQRYEKIATDYDRLASTEANESFVDGEVIPVLEGEYILELDDIMESYGDIAIECVILDLADGLRPGFPDINDSDEPAVEADCLWTFA